MDDNAKMRAIANYVTSHMSYDRDRSKVEDYNYNPIHYALQGTGVCVNYSALTQALCQRANLEGYLMNNDDHVWNLVKLDGQFYYFDITNMMQLPLVSDLLLKINTGFYYKQDPYNTGFSAMTSLKKTEVPEQLLSLIKEAQDEKTFIEKYGSNLYVDLTVLVGVLASIGVIVKVRQHFK